MQSQPITILLADDDPDARALLRDAVSAAGLPWRVRETSSGTEALDYLRRRGPFAAAPRPGLICLDVEMPGLSGHEVLKAVRADGELADIPVLIVTALDDPAEEERALANGADYFAVKPVSPEAFVSAARALAAASESTGRESPVTK
jgi:CheY-like chemotaxis protein